jgi:hypothetical protein
MGVLPGILSVLADDSHSVPLSEVRKVAWAQQDRLSEIQAKYRSNARNIYELLLTMCLYTETWAPADAFSKSLLCSQGASWHRC